MSYPGKCKTCGNPCDPQKFYCSECFLLVVSTVAEFKLRFIAEDIGENMKALCQLQAECCQCGAVLADNNITDLNIAMLIHLSDQCQRNK